jgi:hypothetical protein
MGQIAETSLEARIRDLEAFARSISGGNVTDLASVVNAAGEYVPLSSIAFGEVAAADNGVVQLTGVSNSGAGGVPWAAGTPAVYVYVTGGRLRVDWAAELTASGNNTSFYYSPGVSGPYPSLAEAQAGGGPLAVPPTYDRAIEIQHNATGMQIVAAMGSFSTHTGLAPGWYTVDARYALTYSGYAGYIGGSATNRRLAAAPY